MIREHLNLDELRPLLLQITELLSSTTLKLLKILKVSRPLLLQCGEKKSQLILNLIESRFMTQWTTLELI